MSGVDPRSDRAPVGLVRAQAVRAAALAGDNEVARPDTPAPYVPPDPNVDNAPLKEETPTPINDPTPIQAVAHLAATLPGKTVKLKMTGMAFEFKVSGVSENQHGLALFLGKDVKLELEMATELDITVDSTTHRVVYVGGFFSFPSIGYNLISFLFNKDD